MPLGVSERNGVRWEAAGCTRLAHEHRCTSQPQTIRHCQICSSTCRLWQLAGLLQDQPSASNTSHITPGSRGATLSRGLVAATGTENLKRAMAATLRQRSFCAITTLQQQLALRLLGPVPFPGFAPNSCQQIPLVSCSRLASDAAKL